jgi:hypothetical protein
MSPKGGTAIILIGKEEYGAPERYAPFVCYQRLASKLDPIPPIMNQWVTEKVETIFDLPPARVRRGFAPTGQRTTRSPSSL